MQSGEQRFVNATTLSGCGAAESHTIDVLMGRLRKKIQAQYRKK